MNILMIADLLKSKFGWDPVSIQLASVGGGSINQVYLCKYHNSNVLLKLQNSTKSLKMFETEEAGLDLLRSSATFKIPRVFHVGLINNTGFSYILMEWIDSGRQTDSFAPIFAEKLAAMHRHSNSFYGLEYDNFIGRLNQHNNGSENWNDFFTNRRMLPLIMQATDLGLLPKSTLQLADKLIKNLDSIVPVEPPALLHGDLWSGNYIADTNGHPVLIDPAVYFGHREMDLAMMQLFGGFDDRIFSIYNEYYSLEKGWEKRISLFQLYPVLVHLLLFGSSYSSQAQQIIKRYA